MLHAHISFSMCNITLHSIALQHKCNAPCMNDGLRFHVSINSIHVCAYIYVCTIRNKSIHSTKVVEDYSPKAFLNFRLLLNVLLFVVLLCAASRKLHSTTTECSRFLIVAKRDYVLPIYLLTYMCVYCGRQTHRQTHKQADPAL